MEIENEIELADVAEILVEHFDEVMDDFQDVELVVCDVYTATEVETGIALVD